MRQTFGGYLFNVLVVDALHTTFQLYTMLPTSHVTISKNYSSYCMHANPSADYIVDVECPSHGSFHMHSPFEGWSPSEARKATDEYKTKLLSRFIRISGAPSDSISELSYSRVPIDLSSKDCVNVSVIVTALPKGLYYH